MRSNDISLSTNKIITLSNEYVCSKNKHKISQTNGQAKIKFNEKEFQQIFGSEIKGYVYFSFYNIKNFIENLKSRWIKILENNHEFKNPNILNINSIITKFYKNYNFKDNIIIEEEYSITKYSKDRYALIMPLFTKIIYYLAIPFESFLEIKKGKDNDILISFGLDFSLIKNSILYKQKNEPKDILNNKHLINARKGQDKLRKNLIKIHNKCQITELEYDELLIASHIKPWIFSQEKEKVDINNALLLSATFDKLFDRGLITFSIDGAILFSDLLPSNDIYKLKKIIKNRQIEFNSSKMEYLNYHREKIFRYVNGPISLK